MAAKKFLSTDLIGLIMAFAILGMIGLLTFRTEEDRRTSGLWVRHTLQVQGALSALNGLLQRAESSERGYLLTQDAAYLQNYDTFAARLEKESRRVADLVADNPAQVEKAAKVRPLIDQRLALLGQKVDLVASGHAADAIAIVRQGAGRVLMEQIDTLIADMLDTEERIYESRLAKMDHDTRQLKFAVAAFALVAAAVAAYTIYLSHRQLEALRESRDSVSFAYDALLDEARRRESLESQLRQSQKLEAIGQLTGGVAHDFNNMLAVIVASLNILRRKIERKDEDCDKVIDSALDGADRAANLVKRLLAFARMQPLSPRPLDANKLVSGMSELLRHTLGGGVKLETVLAGGLWTTEIDASELENALLNLAVNARDAMPGGGKLTIETGNCHLDDLYNSENPDVKIGQYVVIAVSDTGAGIPPEILEKVFEPFFTTKPLGKGSGLGLSQVHGFVKQSGGHIKVYSEPGHGTTIKLYLPRYFGDETPSTRRLGQQEPPARGAPEEVLLLVEDNADALRLTAQNLREFGYTVLEANGGAQAIDILRQRRDVVMMISDVVMPDMNGAKLAREATFRRHDLRVLFVTGFTRNAIVHNGVLDPHVHLLTKPFSSEQLGRKVRAILDAPLNG